MIRILAALVTVVVIAAGSFFGFQFYTQYRISSEIETAFEQIRAGGGKASYGRVSFDLPSRTVTIADIAGESAAQSPVKVTIGSIVATNVGQPDAARFSADNITLTDIEIVVEAPTETMLSVTYRAPNVVVKGYSGPASIQRLPASSSMVELYRFGFEQLARMSATSVVAPSLKGEMKFSTAMRGGVGNGNFTYSGFAIEGMENGKIAVMKTDDFQFAFVQPSNQIRNISGNLANFVAYDTDFNAMAAIYDTQKASDDQYYRVHRQISAGPFTAKADQVATIRVDGFALDDLAMRPSKLQIATLMAMTPPAAGRPPTPAQEREMFEAGAKVYEGVRIGNAEMRGLAIQTPEGPHKLSAIRVNLDNGKFNEFAIEGLDTRMPNGPVKVGRFAFKSVDVANLMRMSALFSNPAQPPPPEKALGMISMIEGVEVAGFLAPYKNTGKPINIDVFNLNWGQFVGPVPSKVRLTAKLSAPLDASDMGAQMLAAAGITTNVINADLGAAWTESSRTFVLAPVELELGGMLKASAHVSLANVPQQAFSFNPLQAAAMAAQIEAGTIELTLRDTGGLDLAITAFARAQNVSRDEARQAIIQAIRTNGAAAETSNPDASAFTDALARFVEVPRTTLTLKLTPRAKVPAMQLLQLLQTDPLIALSQFRLEATTAL